MTEQDDHKADTACDATEAPFTVEERLIAVEKTLRGLCTRRPELLFHPEHTAKKESD